eukprot:tig00000498_g1645.t1
MYSSRESALYEMTEPVASAKGGLTKEQAAHAYADLVAKIHPLFNKGSLPRPSAAGPSNVTQGPRAVVPRPAPKRSAFRQDLLAGQVALVTGGGSGICRGIAEAFARHGARVMIVSRSGEKLKKAAEEMSFATGSVVKSFAADVRSPEQIEKACKACVNELGSLDILVNGAAGNFLAAAERLSYNAFKTVVEIDTIGTFNASKAAYHAWMGEHGGVILNISMTLHYNASPLQVHAGSAKAAVDAMTRHLAVEWGPKNIRVNALGPGPVEDTEGFRRLLPGAFKDKLAKSIPLQRMASNHEMEQAALFLCAEECASYVTGAVLPVDGGCWMTQGAIMTAAFQQRARL